MKGRMKKTAAALKGSVSAEVTAATKRKKAIIIIIVAAIAALAIGGAVLGVVLYMNRETGPFDYVGEDLDEYIYISDENYTGYKGYEVTVSLDEITDKTVQTTVNRLLAAKRGEPSNKAIKEPGATVEVGDDIVLFFRAFTEDESGVKTEIGALSNFSVTNEKNRTFTVGGGSLDTLGLYLELSLVGTNLSEYASCEIKAEGVSVEPRDIVYITYDALYNGSRPEHGEAVRIDLSDESVNEGLRNYIIGKKVGSTVRPDGVFEAEDGSSVIYRQIKIERVMRFPDEGQQPLTVTTRVPATYPDTDLQGKEVTFELFIDSAIKYDTPPLDESFIKETLELSDEELAPYQGDTVEKYYAYVRDYLEEAQQAEIDATLVSAMWTHLYNIAEIKKLPKDEVDRLFRRYKTELENAYAANPNGYSTFDEYANAYVSYLGGSTVWKEYFRKEAEAEVKHKLIFYYVAKREGLLPTEAEFSELARNIIEKDVAAYLRKMGIDREDYKTEEEYLAAQAPYRAEVEAVYSDTEYLKWVVHLEFAESKMSKFGKVVYKNPAQ